MVKLKPIPNMLVDDEDLTDLECLLQSKKDPIGPYRIILIYFLHFYLFAKAKLIGFSTAILTSFLLVLLSMSIIV